MINKRWLFMLFFLICGKNAWASGPVLIPSESFDSVITPYVSVYEDTTAQLTIADVLLREVQLRFTPSHSDQLKFGLSSSAYWIRLSISNPYNREQPLVLSLANSRLSQVYLYEILQDPLQSELIITSKAGVLEGGFPQAYPFLVKIPAQTTKNYLLRVQSDSLFSTSVRLNSVEQFLNNEQGHFLLKGLGLGWIFATFSFFLFIGWTRKLPMAWAAALYCLSALVFIPAWTGVTSLMLTLPVPWGAATTALFLGCSAILHNVVVSLLGWKSRAIRWLLLAQSALLIPIMVISTWRADGWSEVWMSSAITINEWCLVVVLFFYRSQQPSAQHPLLVGAIVAAFGIPLTLLTELNFLALDSYSNWSILLLSLVIITSMVAAILLLLNTRLNHSAQLPHNSDASQSLLLAQMTHELRSPINGVIGMSELLQDTPLSNNQRDYMDTVAQAGHDLRLITNEISDYAKLTGSQLEFDKETQCIIPLLDQTLSVFQQEAIRKQVELMLDCSDTLATYYVFDRARLQIILHTVLHRILAYAEQGELRMTAMHYLTDHNSGVRVQFQLTAHLVQQEEFKSIFRLMQPSEPEQSSHHTRHWNLWVVKQLLTQMNATLELDSMSSEGGSITLYLPLFADQFNAPLELDNTLSGLRVLIVDDNASLRSVIERQLKRWGMQVDSTYSGKEALAMLRNQIHIGMPFDVILIDQDMPMMSGLQLAERINNDHDIPHKPALLMLTGMNTNSVKQDAYNLGIQQVVAKPATGDSLRRALLALSQTRST